MSKLGKFEIEHEAVYPNIEKSLSFRDIVLDVAIQDSVNDIVVDEKTLDEYRDEIDKEGYELYFKARAEIQRADFSTDKILKKQHLDKAKELYREFLECLRKANSKQYEGMKEMSSFYFQEGNDEY